MIEERYRAARAAVAAACARAGRDPASVTLVAVSKGHPAEAIRRLYDLGHRDFGESRVQDLEAKAATLPADVRWHFLGALQANKIKSLRPRVALVHSFDRPDLAAAWVAGDAPSPPVLLQVNVGHEPQKRGVAPADAEAAVAAVLAAGARCVGVMALPPREDDPARARARFTALRALRDRLAARWPAVREMSAGMSGDLDLAIAEGATLVRVGTAIFGERDPAPARG